MTEHDAFLAAIIADPWDTGLRLIFADWLEEQGDVRGEFIRVQCALAVLEDDNGAVAHDMLRPKCCCGHCSLRSRERELLESGGDNRYQSNAFRWSEPLKTLGILLGRPWPARATFRRGFVEVIHCSPAAWLVHGAAILQQQPVMEVDFGNDSVLHRQDGEDVGTFSRRLMVLYRLHLRYMGVPTHTMSRTELS